MFCNVRFSVLSVFEKDAGIVLDLLTQGVNNGKTLEHCFCNSHILSQTMMIAFALPKK